MKGVGIIILVLIVCLGLAFGAYVYKYGMPEFFKEEKLALETIVEEIKKGEEIEYFTAENVSIYVYKNTSIVYEINEANVESSKENSTLKAIFTFKDEVLQTTIDTTYIKEELATKIIASTFNAIARMRGHAKDESVYSLILDATKNHTIEENGYEYTKSENMYTFRISTQNNIKLVDKMDIYIKAEDLEYKRDILTTRLKSDITIKPGIAVEKAVTYNDTITIFIYEKGDLTLRTYNSMLNIIQVMTQNNSIVQDIKDNYVAITQKGEIIIDNVKIELNQGISNDCVHYYNYNLKEYSYMKITFKIQDINI